MVELENVRAYSFDVIAIRASQLARSDIEIHIRTAGLAFYNLGFIGFFIIFICVFLHLSD